MSGRTSVLVALAALTLSTSGCGAGRGQGPTAGGDSLSNAAETGRAAAPARACLPVKYRAEELRWDIALRHGPSGATLCVRELDDEGQPGASQCWAVDDQGLGEKRAAPTGSKSQAGRLPGAERELPWVLDNLSGDRRARVTESQVTIMELPSERPIAQIPLRSPSGDGGLSAEPSDAYFVGEVLFIIDHDAGPHADVIAFWPPAESEQVADEVYHGQVAILDSLRVGMAGPGLMSLDIHDTSSGQRSRIERDVPRPAVCTDEGFSEYLLEPDFFCGPDELDRLPAGPERESRSACCAELEKSLQPYMDAPMVALDSERVLVALTGARRGDLAILHLGQQAIVRELPLWCSGGE